MENKMSIAELTLRSEEIRKRLLEVVYKAKAGHIGGDLSSLNVLTALYLRIMNVDPANPKMEGRDRFVMSKGHCVEALYCVLEAKGFIKRELVDTYGDYLKSYKTYVLMGDGEQGEGSIYEAAMAGSNYGLDNLVAFIDRNGLQISDTTENVMKLESVDARWRAFGWDVYDVDGNDMGAIVECLENIDYNNGKPHMVVLHTTKGFHVSYMENVLKWHHGVPTAEEYAQAMDEITRRIEDLRGQL